MSEYVRARHEASLVMTAIIWALEAKLIKYVGYQSSVWLQYEELNDRHQFFPQKAFGTSVFYIC